MAKARGEASWGQHEQCNMLTQAFTHWGLLPGSRNADSDDLAVVPTVVSFIYAPLRTENQCIVQQCLIMPFLVDSIFVLRSFELRHCYSWHPSFAFCRGCCRSMGWCNRFNTHLYLYNWFHVLKLYYQSNRCRVVCESGWWVIRKMDLVAKFRGEIQPIEWRAATNIHFACSSWVIGSLSKSSIRRG